MKDESSNTVPAQPRRLAASVAWVIGAAMLALAGALWWRATGAPEPTPEQESPVRAADSAETRAPAPSPTVPPTPATAATPGVGVNADAASPAPPASTSWVDRAVDIIRAKFRGRPGERYPVDNVAASFADLARRAAAGDLQAARTLDEDLETCATTPRTRVDLEWQIENQQRRFAERGGDAQQHEISIAVTRELHRFCAGVADAHLAQRPIFAGQLAEAGDPDARVDYLWDARPQAGDGRLAERFPPFRERGLHYLQQELDRGNPRALFALASAHADPGLGMQDPRRQYVFAYAYAQTPGLHPYDAIYVGLANLEGRLPAADLEILRREGVALYERCCRR